MISKLRLLLVAGCLLAITKAAPKNDEKKHPTCQEFSHGVVFNETEILGTWHLLHFANEKGPGSAKNCATFVPVTNEERIDLKNRIGLYVENMKWDDLTIKMQTPCDNIKDTKPRNYYLEKLGTDGSYRSIQAPPANVKINLADVHRHLMRLKMIEGQFLGMMDCHEKFVFIMGKQPPQEKQDEKLKKVMNMYWPEEINNTK